MNSSQTELGHPTAIAVSIVGDSLVVDLADGRSLTIPLAWFPRLEHATELERAKWRLIGNGEGIHWPELDEDISVESLLMGRKSGESPDSLRRWMKWRSGGPREPGEGLGSGHELSGDLRNRFPRIYELRDQVSDPNSPDFYFRDFENRVQKWPTWIEVFEGWEKDLQGLDNQSFDSLKSEALPYLIHRDAKGRGWQQLFDILNQARAYNYLTLNGYSRVRFIPRSEVQGRKTPDLEAFQGDERVLCEVKTLNASDNEIKARRNREVRNVSLELGDAFFVKLRSAINQAQEQLSAYSAGTSARYVVYISVCFDDIFCYYKADYQRQIDEHLSMNRIPDVEVVVHFDSFRRRP